jgi:transposase-like protein
MIKAQALAQRGIDMTTVEITLPDQLAQEAQRAGLLSAGQLEKWLREQLRTRRADTLIEAAERMGAVDAVEVLTPEAVAEEIAKMRAERRTAAS